MTAATVRGGALLGVRAWVNRACVFGAIARLGAGEGSYAVTPLGFYVEDASPCAHRPSACDERVAVRLTNAGGGAMDRVSPIAFVLWRIGLFFVRSAAGTAGSLVRRVCDAVTTDLWSLHAATT